MKSLYSYIEKYIYKTRTNIDGHIHLFDWKTKNIFDLYNPSKTFNKFVGFLGVDFNNLDKYDYDSCVKYYDDFINSNNHDVILLASGLDSKTVIDNYERHKNIIKGFGELLCYGRYDNIVLPYNNLQWVEEILEYNVDNLPVFIHYSLISDESYKDIERLISKYKYTPIVICHCGLPNIHEGDYKNELDEIFERFLKLQIKYNNIYTDVCDSAFTYLKNNSYQFQKLDLSRVIIGMDLVPAHFRGFNNIKEKVTKSLKKFKLWKKYINNNIVIKKLFKL